MFSIMLASIILLSSLIHLAFDKQKRTRARMAEIFLLYIFFFEVGIGGSIAFLSHFFYPVQSAEYMGWPPGYQFQQELAFAFLAFGVLGVMCIRLRKDFWIATGIGTALFFIGGAVVRIRDIAVNGNYAPGNAGALLYNNDILAPLVILVLLAIYRKGYTCTTL